MGGGRGKRCGSGRGVGGAEEVECRREKKKTSDALFFTRSFTKLLVLLLFLAFVAFADSKTPVTV